MKKLEIYQNGKEMYLSHMGKIAGHEITVEQLVDPNQIKTSRSAFDHLKYDDKKGLLIQVDAKNFGRSLSEFSEARNIHLRNVVSGGCHGEIATKKYTPFI